MSHGVGRLLFLGWLASLPCAAHVGSPDVFFEGKAGPYPLLIAIRPPSVIPGVARVEIRSLSGDARAIHILPMPLTGPGAKYPPTPDIAQPSKEDSQFFSGSLWMMDIGSWQVRVDVDGSKGRGQLSVPVPALATQMRGMKPGLEIMLAGLMIFLVAGLVSIVGAGVREAQLPPGIEAPPAARKRSYVTMGCVAAGIIGVLWLGNFWWGKEASAFGRRLYKPLQLEASIENGGRLMLALSDPGWLRFRKLDDLVPDHGHMMHLFAIRMPGMDRMYHLHPDESAPGTFALDLPSVAAGQYRLFADVVHEDGLPETPVATVSLPEINGRALAGDDSEAVAAPLSTSASDGATFAFADGYRMVWERAAGPIVATRTTLFQFRMEDAAGQPATDMQMYMGMAGHAEFVKSDASVFAHVHPSGSAPMAAIGLTQPGAMASMHLMNGMSMPASVSFPYGFPEAGKYRIFVQMKRAGEVRTGVFDALAQAPKL